MESSSGLDVYEQHGVEIESSRQVQRIYENGTLDSETSHGIFRTSNGSSDTEVDEEVNLESLPVHEQEEYDGIVDSVSTAEITYHENSKTNCANTTSDEVRRNDFGTSDEETEDDVDIRDVSEDFPHPQMITVSSSEGETGESEDGTSIDRNSSNIPVFEEYCSILMSEEVKVTNGDECSEVEIDSKNNSLERSTSPIAVHAHEQLTIVKCTKNEAVDQGSIDVDPLNEDISEDDSLKKDPLNCEIAGSDPLNDDPLNGKPCNDLRLNNILVDHYPLSVADNLKKSETREDKSVDPDDRRNEEGYQQIGIDQLDEDDEVKHVADKYCQDKDNRPGCSSDLKKKLGKKTIRKAFSIRARRPRKAKEGLTYVENLLVATVRDRPGSRVPSERQLGKKAQCNGSLSKIPAKRSRTSDAIVDGDSGQSQPEPDEICISSDDLNKISLPVIISDTDEDKRNNTREEKPGSGDSIGTAKPVRRRLWRLPRKFKRSSDFEMTRSKPLNNSIVSKNEISPGDWAHGEEGTDIKILTSNGTSRKTLNLYESPRVMSSPRRGSPKKSVIPSSFSNPYGKKWAYMTEHIQDLFADGKFVIHREDLATSEKFDRLVVWRIIRNARVLRKFVPYRIDGRMCHVATDTFKAISDDEEEFVLNYQPVLFDLIIDKPEYAVGMYHHLTCSFPFLGFFKLTANLYQPFQMFLKQLIIQAMSGNTPVESSQSTAGFETIEKRIHENVQASMKYDIWPEDTKICMYIHPTIIFSKSAIDRKKNCVSCTILEKQCVPCYKIAFNGNAYDPHTFTFSNHPGPPQPDHQFCWGCAQNLRVVHRLYHYKYWTYVATRDILSRLYKTLKPEEQYDADSVYQFVVADFKWIRQMFYELQTRLADGLKLQLKLEKQVPNVTIGTSNSSVVQETSCRLKKHLWMQGETDVWMKKARNNVNGTKEKKVKPAVKLKKDKVLQKNRPHPQQLERPRKKKCEKNKKLQDIQTSGGHQNESSAKSASRSKVHTNPRRKTSSRKNSEVEIGDPSPDTLSAIEISDNIVPEAAKPKVEEKQKGKTKKNSVPDCKTVKNSFNRAATPSFYKNPQGSAIAIS